MNRSVLSLVLATLLIGAAGRADAAIIINVQQVGSDVVAMGGGSVDLTGLTLIQPFSAAAQIAADTAALLEGPTSATSFNIYSHATGPGVPFGTGVQTFATLGSGDVFGVDGVGGPIISLPSNYTSGTSLSATDTYSGKTIASLGLTPGTYNYTWGTGGSDHTLTVNIIAPVPEPASLAIWSLGALGCAIAGYRRRKSA
jgi:hypothetical protein